MSVVNNFVNINTDTAVKLVLDAIKQARQMHIEITACVVDCYGFTVAQVSTDNARFQTKEFAFNKAFTASAMRSDTTQWYEKIKDNPQVLQGLTNRDTRFMVLPAGIPLIYQGDFVGAIGISGGSAEEDIAIAKYAISNSGLDKE